MGGLNQPIAVALSYDLAPAIPLDVPDPSREAALELGPPRPNPARASARFEIVMPVRAVASVRLYDPAGRCVATLLEGSLEPGRHEVRVDARRLRAGAYLCRLQAAGLIRTRKLEIAH